MKWYDISAFTFDNQGGNMAGVVIIKDGADFPSDNEMLALASQLGYSETSFVRILGNNLFHTRYFTPQLEVDLCGHATIATFHLLNQLEMIDKNLPIFNKTLAGDIGIYLENEKVFMDMAKPKLISKLCHSDICALSEILGIDKRHISFIKEHLPAVISTGLPDIILEVPSLDVLMNLNVNLKKLADFSRKLDVIGLHCFCEHKQGAFKYHCRNFAPACGIDEESATGTSNGALTYYLFLENRLGHDGFPVITDFIQGEAMNKTSRISTILSKDRQTVSIKVGGTASIV